MAISEQYMTPNLRWGLFLKDHPQAPPPKFELVSNDESGVPAMFQQDECGEPVQGFVRCTIYYPDGLIAAEAEKEIPSKEKRQSGGPVEFKKNAESWMKLCTMALGRCLKRAGYPDSTTDLRAFLLYEQRNAEIDAIRAVPRLAIEAKSVEEQADQVVADAAVAERDTDRPEQHDEDDEIHDVELVDTPDGPQGSDGAGTISTSPETESGGQTGAGGDEADQQPWPDELQTVMNGMGDEYVAKLQKYLETHNLTPALTAERPAALKKAVTQATRLLMEEAEARIHAPV